MALARSDTEQAKIQEQHYINPLRRLSAGPARVEPYPAGTVAKSASQQQPHPRVRRYSAAAVQVKPGPNSNSPPKARPYKSMVSTEKSPIEALARAQAESQARAHAQAQKRAHKPNLSIDTSERPAHSNPKVQVVTPTTAFRALGMSPLNSTTNSPMGSPRYYKRARDGRQKVLERMTAFNLFLGLIMIGLFFGGTPYPGHYGDTSNVSAADRRLSLAEELSVYDENCASGEMEGASASIYNCALILGLIIWLLQPVSCWSIQGKSMGRKGSQCTLVTSFASVVTAGLALWIVLLDMDYLSDCCQDLTALCELSELCTELVNGCCVDQAVTKYCTESKYHLGAASMMFVVFSCNLAMVIMSCTITCRCWVDSDPEKQALMMVISEGLTPRGTPRGSPRGSARGTPRGSPSPMGQRGTNSQHVPRPSPQQQQRGQGQGQGGPRTSNSPPGHMQPQVIHGAEMIRKQAQGAM
ncbi:unnamed protein product, partial [Chrysoparadoxa australica]